jgi:hypothetical protein
LVSAITAELCFRGSHVASYSRLIARTRRTRRTPKSGRRLAVNCTLVPATYRVRHRVESQRLSRSEGTAGTCAGFLCPGSVSAFVAIYTISAALRAERRESTHRRSVRIAAARPPWIGDRPAEAACVTALHRVVSNRRFQRSPGLSSSPKT